MHHVAAFQTWDTDLVSHMVITVYFIALPINLLVNGWALLLYLQKKPSGIPRWLRVANALFLIAQIYYFQFT